MKPIKIAENEGVIVTLTDDRPGGNSGLNLRVSDGEGGVAAIFPFNDSDHIVRVIGSLTKAVAGLVEPEFRQNMNLLGELLESGRWKEKPKDPPRRGNIPRRR